MELTNEFRVGVPLDHAWAVLTDVEQIAPCMPGAQLQEVEGDEYRGIVKVKVGPITAQYKGTATLVERDGDAHRAVLKAEGRDTRGQGNANATVTATLEGDGEQTVVRVVTDLTVTGKVAQFGRGVLADVSAKLIGQFVENLERDVLTAEAARAEDPPAAPAPVAPVTGGGVSSSGNGDGGTSARRVDHPEPEAVDLVATAGSPVAKRLAPVGIVLVLLLLWRRRRRRSRS